MRGLAVQFHLSITPGAMPTPYADLHVHTTYSDGQHDPGALMEMAAERGVQVLAITDHDTLAGWDAARAMPDHGPIDLIPGVELSGTVEDSDVHLLGYGFDPSHTGLRTHLKQLAQARRLRAQQIVEKLNAQGIDLSYEAVQEAAGKSESIGRPHIARALAKGGHVSSHEDAFNTYIGSKHAAYLPTPSQRAEKAIDLIHRAGGVAVLAHPGHWTSERIIWRLVERGLDGIEIIHPSHQDFLIDYYQHIADRHTLLMTGGSDYHGHRSGDDKNLGRCGLSKPQWETLRAKLAKG
jgi:hypothetical protein